MVVVSQQPDLRKIQGEISESLGLKLDLEEIGIPYGTSHEGRQNRANIQSPRCLHSRDVANECKGLPIALVTVGRALQNKHKPLWEDALLQLRRALPINIPGLLADVYRPLELS
ncbi:hypothetical protein HAX54_011507 [Datura stramonium]|uniref:Uncharacterized protein n=1 Tax=Datura stramonium TaxID=4076 RepID=A0ABS8TI59_DATST|nr:hypothetical protein [Datura stramonium]